MTKYFTPLSLVLILKQIGLGSSVGAESLLKHYWVFSTHEENVAERPLGLTWPEL